jgi:hypothetical protein
MTDIDTVRRPLGFARLRPATGFTAGQLITSDEASALCAAS